jgi:preprotein translocase subunit SecE
LPQKENFVAKKKTANRNSKSTAQRKPNAIQRYISETIGELRKVSWPTRQEATNLTVIVIIVTLAMSTFLGLLDFLFSRFFGLLFA